MIDWKNNFGRGLLYVHLLLRQCFVVYFCCVFLLHVKMCHVTVLLVIL